LIGVLSTVSMANEGLASLGIRRSFGMSSLFQRYPVNASGR
jgi:hypothetical protein